MAGTEKIELPVIGKWGSPFYSKNWPSFPRLMGKMQVVAKPGIDRSLILIVIPEFHLLLLSSRRVHWAIEGPSQQNAPGMNEIWAQSISHMCIPFWVLAPIGYEAPKMPENKCVIDQLTDQPTDRQTDLISIVACTRQKRKNKKREKIRFDEETYRSKRGHIQMLDARVFFDQRSFCWAQKIGAGKYRRRNQWQAAQWFKTH